MVFKENFTCFLIVLALCFLHLYELHNNVLSNYNKYLYTEQTYKEEGINIVDVLKEKNNIYDFKYKMYKAISVNNNQNRIIVGKIFSIIIVMVTTLLASMIVTFFGSFAVKSIVADKVPVKNYAIESFNYKNGLFLQLSLVFLVLLFFIMIGFFIGFIWKSMVAVSISLLIIVLLGTANKRSAYI